MDKTSKVLLSSLSFTELVDFKILLILFSPLPYKLKDVIYVDFDEEKYLAFYKRER